MQQVVCVLYAIVFCLFSFCFLTVFLLFLLCFFIVSQRVMSAKLHIILVPCKFILDRVGDGSADRFAPG